MSIDLKNLAVFLPMVAACAAGLNYTMNGRIMQTVAMPTWIFIFGINALLIALLMHFFSPSKVDFSPVLNVRAATFVFVSLLAGNIAWLSMLFVLKNISATYAAIGEISYPFFTALFAYLIFRAREMDLSMAIGGLLIMAGSVIIITDKFKTGG